MIKKNTKIDTIFFARINVNVQGTLKVQRAVIDTRERKYYKEQILCGAGGCILFEKQH